MHPDGMGWSWQEMEKTPPYVKRYCWDFLQIKLAAEKSALDKARNTPHGH